MARARTGSTNAPGERLGVLADDVDEADVNTRALDTYIGYALRRAQVAVFSDFARTLGEHDIRPAQFSVMLMVQAYPGITQSTLCSHLDIEPSRMVGLVHDLEARGFAVRVRCKSDRRSHGLFLTKPGEAELTAVKQLVDESDRHISARLTGEERETLLALLHKLYQG